METTVGREETLADILGARALRTPTDRLLLDVVGGVLIAAAAIWARPAGWALLLTAAACFSCYGCWAFAERRLRAPSGDASAAHGRGWRIARTISAVLGLAAFVALLFTFLGVALGRLIS